MTLPRVSVLMPAYNAEKYIAQAVESILGQTLKYYELIIADDASTDRTWQIINQYAKADKRIHVYQNKIQLGIAATRNRLIGWSKAPYIAWQDADDVSIPARLQEQYFFMEKNPKVGIVGGDLYFFDENGSQNIRKYEQDDKTLRSSIFRYSPIAQPVAMVRRECFERCGYFSPKYIVASDLDMAFRIGMKYRFANIPKTLLYYRVHCTSITSRKIRENELTTMQIRDFYKNTKQYRMKNFDRLFNLLQKFGVYVVPSHIKRWLFSFFRNNPIDKAYVPQTQFHLLKQNNRKPVRPPVSVLMPAYNAENYIGEAIESILNQTFKNFEFIIVDDASTDNTWNIIRRYAKKDKRIIAKQNKTNLYIAKNRNVLVNLAKRKYIAWQDADDISLSERLQKQYELMEQNPKVGMVGGYLEFFSEKGIESIRKYAENDIDIRKTIFRYSPVAQPTAMIQRECFDKVGLYNPKHPPAEDLDMSFRIGMKYQFANIPQITLKYRQYDNSATFQKLKKIELITLYVRSLYQETGQYKMNTADKIFNLLQYLFVYLIPTRIKVKLFNLFRNNSIDRVYVPKTKFHLLKQNNQKPLHPLVSVLMPAYNAEKYIGEAIESILNQTFGEFEFIIVDDASTDNTWSVIQKYAQKDKRIRVYRNKKNMKSCRTYIRAMKLAKGKYLAIMDNDDISYPDRIKKQFKLLESHPEVGIVGGILEIIDKDGNYIARRRYQLTDGKIRKYIFKYSPFAHPLVMIRKSVLEKIGYYNPKYAPADDYDLYFRIGKVAKFANLPDVLLKYRVLSNSITNKATRRMDFATIEIRYAYNNYPYKMSLSDGIFTFIQYLTIFVVPSKMRIWLFNFLRNS